MASNASSSAVMLTSALPSYETCVFEDAQLDGMVRRTHRNHLESPLLRLPDSLLVRIMAALDLDCILKLRHVSRDVMRLFSTEKIFEMHHLTPELAFKRFQYTARIWTPPAAFFPRQAASWMGLLCSSCSQRRQGDIFGKKMFETMPSLYCSGCKSPHKLMHFSAIERAESDSTERLCLGHEFPLIICCHKWMTLHQVKMLAKHKPNKSLSCGRIHDAGHPCCKSVSCPYDGRPVFRCYTDDSGKTRLHLEFGVHIKFKKLPSGKACPHNLRDEIVGLLDLDSVGYWKDFCFLAAMDPMRCFDPNVCDCVEWFPASPQGSHVRWKLRPDDRTTFREPAATEGHPYISTSGRCAFARHGFTTQYEGMEVRVDFMRCPGRDDLLVFRQSVDCIADTASASGAGWGNLVARLSYHPERDDYLRGLVTCSSPSCGLWKLSIFNKHAALYLG